MSLDRHRLCGPQEALRRETPHSCAGDPFQVCRVLLRLRGRALRLRCRALPAPPLDALPGAAGTARGRGLAAHDPHRAPFVGGGKWGQKNRLHRPRGEETTPLQGQPGEDTGQGVVEAPEAGTAGRTVPGVCEPRTGFPAGRHGPLAVPKNSSRRTAQRERACHPLQDQQRVSVPVSSPLRSRGLGLG